MIRIVPSRDLAHVNIHSFNRGSRSLRYDKEVITGFALQILPLSNLTIFDEGFHIFRCRYISFLSSNNVIDAAM